MELFFFAGLGWVCFFIGLGLIINGFLFTIPRKFLTDKSSEAESQRKLDAQTADLVLPEAKGLFSSVTEETTRHLDKK